MTSACVVIQTDADTSDTLSGATVDANGASVYSSGSFKSQAPAGTSTYYLTGPHMTYQNSATTTWPDGTYKTIVTLDSASTSTATWTVGALPPIASPTPTIVSTSAPTVASTPAAPIYHVQHNAPYSMHVLPYQGMRTPLLGAAIDSGGDVLVYAASHHVDISTDSVIYDNHHGLAYGYAWDAGGNDHAVAFPLSGSPALDLQTIPGTMSSQENAVNAAGVVAGTAVLNGTLHITRYRRPERSSSSCGWW